MALTPAERYARHKAKRKEEMLEMIRTGKPLPPKKKFTEAQLAVRRSQSAKRMKKKQKMIEEKMRKGEPVHIPMTHAERQAQYRARKKQKELEEMIKHKVSGKSNTRKKSLKERSEIKPHRLPMNSEASFKFPIFTPFETFVFKPEPVEQSVFTEELINCRCCFKMLSNSEVQHPVNAEAIQILRDITQLILEPSELAPSFCENCFNDLVTFHQFQQLAILKQQKFNEIIRNKVGDINSIYDMQLNLDPFNIGIKIKDEDFDDQFVKQEFLSVVINDFETLTDSPVEAVSDVQKEKCLNCNEITKNMKRHLQNCKRLSCKICKFTAVKPSLLDHHVKKKHKTSSQLRICQLCEKPFINLERHIVAVHEKTEKCFCDLCGYVSSNRAYVEFHMKSWHLEKEFKCDHCDFLTFTQERLDKHLLIVHKEKKVKKITKPEDLKCPECEKIFKSKKNAESHILRVHRKMRDIKCDKCPKTFFTSCDLKQHQDHIHNNSKEVICEICGKAFPLPRSLRSHMVRHAEPQYSCEICGMTFFYKSMVKRHIDNLHLNVFSHFCKICNKGFRDLQKLKYHRLKHAGVKFHCFVPGCTSTTSRPDALKFHMKHNHSLSPDEQKEFLEKLKEYYYKVMSNA